jgi:hypothetical protein
VLPDASTIQLRGTTVRFTATAPAAVVAQDRITPSAVAGTAGVGSDRDGSQRRLSTTSGQSWQQWGERSDVSPPSSADRASYRDTVGSVGGASGIYEHDTAIPPFLSASLGEYATAEQGSRRGPGSPGGGGRSGAPGAVVAPASLGEYATAERSSTSGSSAAAAAAAAAAGGSGGGGGGGGRSSSVSRAVAAPASLGEYATAEDSSRRPSAAGGGHAQKDLWTANPFSTSSAAATTTGTGKQPSTTAGVSPTAARPETNPFAAVAVAPAVADGAPRAVVSNTTTSAVVAPVSGSRVVYTTVEVPPSAPASRVNDERQSGSHAASAVSPEADVQYTTLDVHVVNEAQPSSSTTLGRAATRVDAGSAASSRSQSLPQQSLTAIRPSGRSKVGSKAQAALEWCQAMAEGPPRLPLIFRQRS